MDRIKCKCLGTWWLCFIVGNSLTSWVTMTGSRKILCDGDNVFQGLTSVCLTLNIAFIGYYVVIWFCHSSLPRHPCETCAKQWHWATLLLIFLIRLEQDSSAESQEAIRNLVLMVASLTMCGYIELGPSQASMGSLFQMLGFALPQPSGRGELCHFTWS
jgi:hypothetical protein